MSRIEKIKSMLESDPDSEMLLYMLAMECRKEGDAPQALEVFGKLQQQHPPHVPSFFMAAQVQAEAGEIESARGVLRAGIEEARSQGDSHAAGEMAELLASLGSQ